MWAVETWAIPAPTIAIAKPRTNVIARPTAIMMVPLSALWRPSRLTRMELPAPRASAFWARYLPAQYFLIRLLDPFVRAWWHAFGLGNVVELHVAGRRSGRARSVLLGLLRDEGRWFLGHPNGD